MRVPALVGIFAHVSARLEKLRTLELDKLVDELFPPDTEAVADLRATALDALVQATGVGDLLRSIVESVTQDDVPQSPDFVRVMSLHKSKGLTSPSVYIVGTVQGVLPTLRSDEPSEVDASIQEGRRLFYVAVTRAAEELTISGSISADLADASARGVAYSRVWQVDQRHVVRTIASPYLNELGPAAPTAVKGGDWLSAR